MGNRICICILNFNNATSTVKCLESVFMQSHTDYQVALIDNHSSDNSVEVINAFLAVSGHPERVVVIEAEKNGGYSSGNNLGIRYAQKAGDFTHILIINNDVLLSENFLTEMLRSYNLETTTANSPNIAMGAQIADKTGKIKSKGFYYLIVPFGLVTTFPWVPSFKYITGSCIFLPVNTPLMDEGYFLYYDDVEFSKILKRKDFVLSVSANSVYFHDEGGSTKGNPLRHQIIFRSMKRFYRLNYPTMFPFVVIFRSVINLFLGRFRLTCDLIRIAMSEQ